MEQRIIKFRAWNGSKMLKQDEIAFTPGISNIAFRLSDMLYILTKDYAVMQFTGLLDKNGKEIFEGDVLEKNYGAAEPLMTGDKEKFAERWIVEFFRGEFVMNRIGLGYSVRLSDFAEERAVIGNIYENPDLLSPSQKGGE